MSGSDRYRAHECPPATGAVLFGGKLTAVGVWENEILGRNRRFMIYQTHRDTVNCHPDTVATGDMLAYRVPRIHFDVCIGECWPAPSAQDLFRIYFSKSRLNIHGQSSGTSVCLWFKLTEGLVPACTQRKFRSRLTLIAYSVKMGLYRRCEGVCVTLGQAWVKGDAFYGSCLVGISVNEERGSVKSHLEVDRRTFDSSGSIYCVRFAVCSICRMSRYLFHCKHVNWE